MSRGSPTFTDSSRTIRRSMLLIKSYAADQADVNRNAACVPENEIEEK
jgi:hypothetical protein